MPVPIEQHKHDDWAGVDVDGFCVGWAEEDLGGHVDERAALEGGGALGVELGAQAEVGDL